VETVGKCWAKCRLQAMRRGRRSTWSLSAESNWKKRVDVRLRERGFTEKPKGQVGESPKGCEPLGSGGEDLNLMIVSFQGVGEGRGKGLSLRPAFSGGNREGI